MRFIRVACDQESLIRLRNLAKLWREMPAAHQSNILNAAVTSLCVRTRMESKRMLAVRVANDVDGDRFRKLAEYWPDLDPRKQQELLEHGRTVCGLDAALQYFAAHAK